MVRVAILVRCRKCGNVQWCDLSRNARLKAIEKLKRKIKHHGTLSRNARAFLFYNFGLRFRDADMLVREMLDVGAIKTVRPGFFKVR